MMLMISDGGRKEKVIHKSSSGSDMLSREECYDSYYSNLIVYKRLYT